MRRIDYAKDALLDLVSLAAHSRAEWGEAHARSYFEGLERTVARLALTPELGSEVPEIKSGLRRLIYRALAIYYTVELDAVYVVDLLHGRQDAASALADRP